MQCSACGKSEPRVIRIADLRRTYCEECHHSERVDIQPFDYAAFPMGSTGANEARVRSQADFVADRLSREARALEIGCAAGELGAAIRARCGVAAYDGVEFSPAKEIARGRLDRVFDAPLAHLLDHGLIAPGGYDMVLSSHCLEHLTDVGGMIAAMAAALKPDGVMFLEIPNRSGARNLPFDDNRSHIHFFTMNSLARLLARHGFEVVVAQSGARLDDRYSDSLRILAQRASPPTPRGYCLSDMLPRPCGEKIVIWGAGRMVEEMLAHYFDPERIAFFVDKDAGKQGGVRLGAPIRSPAALREGLGQSVLVNSLEMEAAIRAEIEGEYAAHVDHVVAIAELLAGLDARSRV